MGGSDRFVLPGYHRARWYSAAAPAALLAALVALAALLVPVAMAAEAGECANAQAQLNGRQLDAAWQSFADALKKNAASECAKAGLTAVGEARAAAVAALERGRALEARGEIDQARIRYTEALQGDPQLADAQKALQQLGRPAESPTPSSFDAVRRLAEAGYYSAARDQIKKVVQDAKGPVPTVPSDLRYLVAEEVTFEQPFRRRLGGGPFLQSAREGLSWLSQLLTLGIAAFLVWVAVKLARHAYKWRLLPWWQGYAEPRLDIMDFEKGPADADIGKAFASMVEDALQRLHEPGVRPVMHLITGSPQEIAIPAEVKGFTPQMKLVADLLQWALPQNVITFSGTMQRSATLGLGVTLVLADKRRNSIIAEHTLWQRDYDPAAALPPGKDTLAYEELASIAAVWLLYQLHRHKAETSGDSTPPFSMLGTNSWESYALFQAGVEQRLRGTGDSGRLAFFRAFQRDDANRGAALNLGVLYAQQPGKDQATKERSYARAADLLSRVMTTSACANSNEECTDQLWYRAAYALAVTHLYQKVPVAEVVVNALVARIAATRAKYCAPATDAPNSEIASLCAMLAIAEPMTQVLRGSITVALGAADQRQVAKAEVDAVAGTASAYRVQYNLACFYSRYGAAETGATRADAFAESLTCLENALEYRGTIVSHAEEDPGLEGVRTDVATEKKFQQLLERYGEKKEADEEPPPVTQRIVEALGRLLAVQTPGG
jgi:surface antigen